MTKNHILIRSVALGVLLSLSPLAKAGNVDQLLVIYFDKLYPPGSQQSCKIDPVKKTEFLSALDKKNCINRQTSSNGEQFIVGFKTPCTDKDAREYLDLQVNALCNEQAQKAARDAKLQQAKNQSQQPGGNAGSGNSGSGGGGGGGGLAQGLGAITNAAMQAHQAGLFGNGSTGAAAGKPGSDGKVQEIPKVGNSTIYGNNTGGAVNKAIDSANERIRAYNNLTPEQKKDLAQAQTDYRTAAEEFKIKCSGDETVEGCAGLKESMAKATQQAKDAGGTVDSVDKDIAEGRATAQRQNNPDVKKEGEGATDTQAPEPEDAELTARHAKSKTEDEALMKQIDALKKQIEAAQKALPQEATTSCNANEATRNITTPQTVDPAKAQECEVSKPQAAINCINKEVAELEKAKAELQKQKLSCSDSSAQAEKLCSMVRSDKAQKVQKLMSIGATVLSKVTAASESCGTTADLSKIAQGGILAAQGSCIAMKARCDLNCDSAKNTITKMKVNVEAIKKCQASALLSAQSSGKQVDMAAEELAKTLGQELQPEKSVPSAVTQCKNHKFDVLTMGLAALGFLSAFQDADQCKKQLATGGGANGNGTNTSSMVTPTMTTAEYCAIPGNATSITCKCTANPSADGCMGSIAGSGVGLGKINAGSGASGFASAKQNGLGALDPLSKSTTGSSELEPGANLSEGARAALGIGGSAEGSGSLGGGGGAGLASNPEKAKAAAKEEKEKPKFGFFSSIGNMFSGGKSASTAAKAAIRGYEQDQAIKRKLASDQVRSEITTASGKSNFDKIKSAYKSNLSSFEQ